MVIKLYRSMVIANKLYIKIISFFLFFDTFFSFFQNYVDIDKYIMGVNKGDRYRKADKGI